MDEQMIERYRAELRSKEAIVFDDSRKEIFCVIPEAIMWGGRDSAFARAQDIAELFNNHSVIAGKVAELTEALTEAAERLEGLSTWRDDARAHDDDMGHEQREFSDDDDWDMAEQAASRAAAKARAALAPYPERR